MNRRFLVGLSGVAVLLWLVWAIVPFIFWCRSAPLSFETMGQWGDAFGALNALFSGAAFATVLFTIREQQKQINESRKDFGLQRFEDTFFQMLRMIREARDEVRFSYSGPYRSKHQISASLGTLHGHDAFRAAYKEMRYRWKESLDDPSEEMEICQEIALIYKKNIHKRYESTFGAYYRLIYGILDRVRNEEILDENQKDSYGNIVRRQFTSFEALLAGCNGLNDFAKDFEEIITRFRLLKYAHRGEVYDALQKCYPRAAFLGRDEIDFDIIEDEDEDLGEDLQQIK